MGVTKETKEEGDGKNFPKKGDTLTMHYHGTLKSNGKKFDASRDRGKPFQFKIGIGQVIQGWDEGVMQMSLGEKAVLNITSDYGYGEGGAGDVIPPNADLVFEVELLGINDNKLPEAQGVRKEIIMPGDGKNFPKKGDNLTMHYIGTLAEDGTRFDASRTKGRPFKFKIGEGKVIQGWDEGVMKMSLGEKATLYIKSFYGYGKRGAGGGVIPPHADLVFEVDLLGINDLVVEEQTRN